MNIPNKITFARILLTPVFAIVFLSPIAGREILSAIVFAIMMATDKLDGSIARKTGKVTNLGKLLDPLADKLSMTVPIIFLVGKGVPAWMASIIISRDILVTGLRTIAAEKGKVIAADWSGKIKTAVLAIGIFLALLSVPGAYWILLLGTLLSAYSLIDYFWKERKLLSSLLKAG